MRKTGGAYALPAIQRPIKQMYHYGNPVNTGFFGTSKPKGIIPTRSIHFSTKHIGLVFSSFDAIITAIMPIIFGFK